MPPGKPHYRHTLFYCTLASQVVLLLKNPPASAGDVRNLGSIPGYGKSPEGGHFLSTPVFFPGAWWATVHRVTKSQTQLKPLSVHACKYYSFYKLKAWQSCVKQGFWHHFSNNICSTCVSVLHFSSCHNISSFIILCYSNLWSVIFAVSLVIIFEVPNNSHTSR